MKMWGSILVAILGLGLAATNPSTPRHVDVIDITGFIGPATAEYVSRTIDDAAQQQAECLIVRMNTPGGALDATQKIVEYFLADRVPIVVYVYPSGGSATSAGCIITFASDLVAMAPASTIGSAHPVTSSGGDIAKDMKKKVENWTVSMVEAAAAKRGRNVKWAKSAVMESANVTAEEALKQNIVNLIAVDLPDLLKKLDGRTVRGHVLHTAAAQVNEKPMSFWEDFIAILSHPNLAAILLLIAIYGIVGEVTNPGAILPGVAGAIALVLLLFMFSILPVNAVGLLMILLAITLFIIDVFAPTHGILTGGGIVAFFIGLLMLFGRGDAFYHISMSLIIPATAVTALFFLFVVGKGLAAQRLPVKVGHEILIGKTTAALSRIDTTGGKVFVEGEYWNAVAETPVEKNSTVQIIGIDGLTLKVKGI